MKSYLVAVSTRCVEWHTVTAPSPAAALAAYNNDRTHLLDDEVISIEGVRVLERESQTDVTIAANAETIQ